MSGTNIAWFRTKGFVSDEEEKGKGKRFKKHEWRVKLPEGV